MAETDWSDPASRLAYAIETFDLAEELWSYIFPPWRWREWWRRWRIVRERIHTYDAETAKRLSRER